MKEKTEQTPETNPNPVLTIENDGTILYSNEASEPLLNEWGMRVGEKVPSSVVDLVQRVISRNSPEKIEVKAGNRVYLIVFHPIPEEECVKVSGFDISDQKELEENLRESEEALKENEARIKTVEAIEAERKRFNDILDTIPAMICLLTPDYHVAFANRRFREKFGESGGRHCYEYCYGCNEPCEFCESFKVFETGQPHKWEAPCPDGSVIEAHDLPFTDIDGSPMILEMDIDITERKKAEEALAKVEIARKQEIHHRIKNNLQVISSLLDLQAEQFKNKECIEDSEVFEAFRESQDRVISMALIHEELHKGREFETLNFSPYIEKLAENLFQTYSFGNTDISLKLDLTENTFFDMDVAIPLVIIVNELVTNSFKHAFPDKKKGEIRIGLQREVGECIKCINEDCSTSFALTISDNGIGIPEDLDLEDFDSLGFQLVTTLVDQLDGELELKRDNGTEFTIRFTVEEKESQASEQAAHLV